ncbi:hypothetical protein CVT24_009442 [Panaeolus cyanescens]|uniref:Uncharacterized protein n=1 Tax=Panaeolus cyanescens TaxID=181874 RepID=A0A409X0U9_9AGAR|nr:hypothetical protein CVT24_009442 [Panaeolus cyanescens]
MSTAAVSLPSDVPTFEDVDCLVKLVSSPKGSFNMRLLYLNSAADAALLWRPHADILRGSKEHVHLVCEIRSAYYKLEAEAKYSLNTPVREFKFPKQYHLIADFTKALIRSRDPPESTNPSVGASPSAPNAPATPVTAPAAPAVVSAPAAAPNVPTEPAADRNNGNRRARSSRTKTPKYVPDGADDSDIDITIPKDVSTVAVAPKGPASASDGDIVMSDAVTIEAPAASTSNSVPSEPKGSRSGTPSTPGPLSKSASSSTPAKAELKSLPSFRSSGLGKRSRLDDSASLGARNAVADLEAEVKYLDVRISVLTRTRDHLRALIDAL